MQNTPFVPYPTMFKLSPEAIVRIGQDADAPPKVIQIICVDCRTLFPLTSLFTEDLKESYCPCCHVTAEDFWSKRAHKRLP